MHPILTKLGAFYNNLPKIHLKNLTFSINFLPNFPPISIPFSKEMHPILTELGAFYNNLPKIHPSYVIWAPLSLMKPPIAIPNFAKKHPKRQAHIRIPCQCENPPPGQTPDRGKCWKAIWPKNCLFMRVKKEKMSIMHTFKNKQKSLTDKRKDILSLCVCIRFEFHHRFSTFHIKPSKSQSTSRNCLQVLPKGEMPKSTSDSTRTKLGSQRQVYMRPPQELVRGWIFGPWASSLMMEAATYKISL